MDLWNMQSSTIVKVTDLTISKAPHDFTKKRLFEAGLSERAKVLLTDYRNQKVNLME